MNGDAQAIIKTVISKFDLVSKNENAKTIVVHIKEKVLINERRPVTKPAVSDMIQKFQKAVHGQDVYRHYFLLLQDLDIKIREETADIIYWLLLESILYTFLKKDIQTVVDLSSEALTVDISETELQTLRYAAGYIVLKLKKHSKDELCPVIDKYIHLTGVEPPPTYRQ